MGMNTAGRSWFACMLGAALFLFVWAAPPGRGADSLAASRPRLSGMIQNEAGEPVKGARVFIYTAAPKEGIGVLCPSCYADCRKRGISDEQGRFAIEDLDPTLLFRVLVVATGH